MCELASECEMLQRGQLIQFRLTHFINIKRLQLFQGSILAIVFHRKDFKRMRKVHHLDLRDIIKQTVKSYSKPEFLEAVKHFQTHTILAHIQSRMKV